MIFYIGTHRVPFLEQTDVPLFVSRRILFNRKKLPRARGRWSLDSGGFTELNLYGEWRVDPRQYVQEIRRFSDEIGGVDWASQQDWMCEEFVLKKTGLSVLDHQIRTVDNFLELRSIAPDLPIIPVIQGDLASDYLRHIEMFANRGVDLFSESTVGVGSVCRRQGGNDIARLFATLHHQGLSNLHGFGVKKSGLKKIDGLKSCDSLAWSFAARKKRHEMVCPNGKKTCAHCLHYALEWRDSVLNIVHKKTGSQQMGLFDF